MTQRTAYHPKLCEECNKPLVECICLTGFKFENQVLGNAPHFSNKLINSYNIGQLRDESELKDVQYKILIGLDFTKYLLENKSLSHKEKLKFLENIESEVNKFIIKK